MSGGWCEENYQSPDYHFQARITGVWSQVGVRQHHSLVHSGGCCTRDSLPAHVELQVTTQATTVLGLPSICKLALNVSEVCRGPGGSAFGRTGPGLLTWFGGPQSAALNK